MGKVFIMEHPLIQHKIGIIRNSETGTKDFREMVGEIATLECYEATRDLELEEYPVTTPMGDTTCKRLSGKKLAIIPILRAGLGMVPGMQTLLPAAKVGHIGLYRDPETLAPIEYYCKLPADIEERDVFVVDPMLATGGSAVQLLKDSRRSRKRIRMSMSMWAHWMIISMRSAILFRDSAMPATGSSVQSKECL